MDFVAQKQLFKAYGTHRNEVGQLIDGTDTEGVKAVNKEKVQSLIKFDSYKQKIMKVFKFFDKEGSKGDRYVIDGVEYTEGSARRTIDSILAHRSKVKKRMMYISNEIAERSDHHDDSKLQQPELGCLIEMDKEGRCEYGTKEYYEKMRRWSIFFKHHYENNRHHPDHFEDGIMSMNIVDLCEFTADIISYFDKVHPDQAFQTIDNQAKRFNLDEQIKQIIKNTMLSYFIWMGEYAPAADEDLQEEKA